MQLRVNARTGGPLLAVATALVLILSTGCSGIRLPGVYRLDIQQGNEITDEMLDQVELGMDRRKVRFILGTPLLTDPFNDDRWDYLYSLKKGSGDRTQRHVSLVFENDVLARIEGDVRSGTAVEGAGSPKDTVVTVPAQRRKQGFFAGLVPDFLSTEPAKRTVPAVGAESPTSVAAVGVPEGGAPAAEGGPEPISAEDVADLEKLFGDFGRLDAGADEPAPILGPKPRQDFESR
jgi:outer membrane protein assembly factor BamE